MSAPPPTVSPAPPPYAGARSDEMHVLLDGLAPVAATVALLLADAGVCLLNVNDRSPVTAGDAAQGPYAPALMGVAREYAVRKLLRERWSRCVPLSAPELFCTSLVPTAVMLRTREVAGPLPRDLAGPVMIPAPDPQLPVLTVVSDGATALTWPVTPWSSRPCRECLVRTVTRARRVLREDPPVHRPPVATEHGPALRTVCRVATAAQVAVDLLERTLDPHGHAPDAGAGDPAADIGLRYGTWRTTLPGTSDCLCSLPG